MQLQSHLSISGGSTASWLEVHSIDHFSHELHLEADVSSSWKKGDEVVVASTDFDWSQAEVFEVEEVNGKTVKVKGKLTSLAS